MDSGMPSTSSTPLPRWKNSAKSPLLHLFGNGSPTASPEKKPSTSDFTPSTSEQKPSTSENMEESSNKPQLSKDNFLLFDYGDKESPHAIALKFLTKVSTNPTPKQYEELAERTNVSVELLTEWFNETDIHEAFKMSYVMQDFEEKHAEYQAWHSVLYEEMYVAVTAAVKKVADTIGCTDKTVLSWLFRQRKLRSDCEDVIFRRPFRLEEEDSIPTTPSCTKCSATLKTPAPTVISTTSQTKSVVPPRTKRSAPTGNPLKRRVGLERTAVVPTPTPILTRAVRRSAGATVETPAPKRPANCRYAMPPVKPSPTTRSQEKRGPVTEIARQIAPGIYRECKDSDKKGATSEEKTTSPDAPTSPSLSPSSAVKEEQKVDMDLFNPDTAPRFLRSSSRQRKSPSGPITLEKEVKIEQEEPDTSLEQLADVVKEEATVPTETLRGRRQAKPRTRADKKNSLREEPIKDESVDSSSNANFQLREPKVEEMSSNGSVSK